MNFLTKTRLLALVIVVETLLLGAILATFGYRYYRYSRDRQDRHEHLEAEDGKPHQPRDYMSRALNLTPGQREEFRAARRKFRQTFDTLEHRVRAINEQLTNEVVRDEPSRRTLDSLLEQLGQAQREQKAAVVEHLMGVKSRCTPEQRAEFNKHIRRMHDYRQKQSRKEERMRRGHNPRNSDN